MFGNYFRQEKNPIGIARLVQVCYILTSIMRNYNNKAVGDGRQSRRVADIAIQFVQV